MSSNAINNPNSQNNSNVEGLRQNIISQLLFKFGDIRRIVDDLEKTSSKKDEIKTKRDELILFYDKLENDIQIGLYDNDADAPENIFDKYIDNLNNELSSLTDKKLDDDDAIEIPLSCKDEVIQWLNNDISIPRVPNKDEYEEFIDGKSAEDIKNINICLFESGISIIGVNLAPKPIKRAHGDAGAGAGAGAGGVPQVDNKEEVLLEKVDGIKSMLGQNGNFSLEPKIEENTVTLVAISKDKDGIKYDTVTINNIDAGDYMKGEHTYNPVASSKSWLSRGGKKHFKTIRNKNRNYRKTEKAGKKHVSKHKRVKLNKHRRTHRK